MNPNHKKAYTLIEILVVLIIMGFLVALVLPKFGGTLDFAGAKLNKSQMQEIKRASLEFYNDVGFVADNVTLLTHPFEKCEVNETNFENSNSSDICKNMIAFIDRHYKFTGDGSSEIRTTGTGDNGSDTIRTNKLINIIEEKLNPDMGWRGGYIGANGFLKSKNIKELGDSGSEDDNKYFFADLDLKLYDGDSFTSLNDIDSIKWNLSNANDELYPISTDSFTSTLNSLYENAKYRKTLLGATTILDPYGTPYEIQIPTASAVGAGKVRTKFARIVSFGKDRRRDTNISILDIDYSAKGYDDSVLYIFENNQTSYFHPEDEKND